MYQATRYIFPNLAGWRKLFVKSHYENIIELGDEKEDRMSEYLYLLT